MHEYEFRYVVQDTTPFHLQDIFPECTVQVQPVWYVKPHFRYKNKRLETKHIVSTEAVFYDGLWFKWVHSIETPHISWSSLTHKNFLDAAGNFQCPFRNETRHVWTLDNQAQVYTFAHPDGTYRLVFEWEYGVFFKPIKKFDTESLLENLGKYWQVYEYFRSFSSPPYRINETFSRKPVTCVANFQGLKGVFAHKLDGTFGLVYSFPEYIKEKWEGGIHKIHKGISLGDGIVFSAEKLSNGTVVLLDVYQVRGFPTAQWNREIVLMNFLHHLSLPEGYEMQKYCQRVEDLPMIRYETDGYIIHNTTTDKIVKVKHTHSLDVVYMDGFFWLPGKEKPGLYRRFKALEKGLQNGHVYEVSVKNGNVLRERKDRFIGNTWKQIENILEKQSWQGPTIHEVVKVIKTTKRKCKSKAT
ncbi:uncharacterized protein TNCT_128631 [Trichonephila clavata]|uniref:Uncharacterized protein n=1 Tax=Trichonephila clavata TaxID=2740835 RepID=A0A8X6F0N1_TRICU|nr:uncharacterized protein TNCT_128631 [Trichonephila clavata]